MEENQLMITLDKHLSYYGNEEGKNLSGYADYCDFLIFSFLSKLRRIKRMNAEIGREIQRLLETQIHSLSACLSALYLQLLFSLNSAVFAIWMSLWCWTQKVRFWRVSQFQVKQDNCICTKYICKNKRKQTNKKQPTNNENIQNRYNRHSIHTEPTGTSVSCTDVWYHAQC